MTDRPTVNEHVRVRCGAKTAFVCVDVRSGATGETLRAAAAEALGLEGTVGLLRDADRDTPLEDHVALSAQGVSVDDLVWAVRKDPAGRWEIPRAAPEVTGSELLTGKVPRDTRLQAR